MKNNDKIYIYKAYLGIDFETASKAWDCRCKICPSSRKRKKQLRKKIQRKKQRNQRKRNLGGGMQYALPSIVNKLIKDKFLEEIK